MKPTPAHDRRRPVAPVVAARVLEPRLRAGVAGQRLRSCAPPAIARSSSRSSFSSADQVGGAGEDVVAKRPALAAGGPLVVQRDPRALLPRELAALERDLAR